MRPEACGDGVYVYILLISQINKWMGDREIGGQEAGQRMLLRGGDGGLFEEKR